LSYGAAFGAIQHIPRIVPGLPQVKAQTAGKPVPQQRKTEQAVAANYTKVQEVGGLVGRVLLALLAVRIVSRRVLLRLFQGPGVILMPIVFAYAAVQNPSLFTLNLGWLGLGVVPVTLLHVGIFLAGVLTVGQFSFWGNYLPRVYPLHLRGTGESFAANIGGRMIGTSFAWVTTTIAMTADKAFAATKLAYTAAGVALFVYVAGLAASWWLPEPKAGELPE
jgi:hypothetical protein